MMAIWVENSRFDWIIMSNGFHWTQVIIYFTFKGKKHGLHSKKSRLMGIFRISGCNRHTHVADMKGVAN